MHPLQREYLDRFAECQVYYANKLKDMDADLAHSPDFAAMVNCAMIGLTKEVGFPKEPAAIPTPEFKRASEQAKLEPEPPKAEDDIIFDATSAWGDGPISCPKCRHTVNPRTSQRTGENYYKCVPCAIFINEDGSTPPAHGMVK